MRIGVVAPARGIDAASAERVLEIAAGRATVVFHPQCFVSHGHFAGTDYVRAEALLEMADDNSIDAIWFARGGYGSARIVDPVLARLGPSARDKRWLGYSDAGTLLAALHRRGAAVAHGPMPADVRRVGGEVAIERALDWLVGRNPLALEPGLGEGRALAFNLTILGHLVGTPHLPDLDGRTLLVEEVAEPIYRIDRTFAHLHLAGVLKPLAALRLGRVTEVPPNDPDFGQDEEAVARRWCQIAGIPFGPRADIGHDVDNKVVPFG